MQIVLLSGGSGKRLWPLSNDVRSKQFLKLLIDENGNKQSMVQRVMSQIKETQPTAEITIATNVAQVDSIRGQLGDDVSLVIEPERRDTFPAVSFACAYLSYERGIDLDETVIVLPVDPFTELSFFSAMSRLNNVISSGLSDIALIGIKPLLPTSKYGYIVANSEETEHGAYIVSQFVEKPDEKTAENLIANGAYWNGGVFAFRLGYMMDILNTNLQVSNFEDLRSRYSNLEKISFDYKVVEKAKCVSVVPYYGKWTDIGTWRTLTDEMTTTALGLVVEENTRNTFIINELNIPIVSLGTKDLIIAASPDGILISDLIKSSQLKPIVDKLENARPMYEERRWGEYTVLAQHEDSLVKRLFLEKGKSISYQSHKHRDEIWVVTTGTGNLVVDGKQYTLSAGDYVKIYRNQKHRILAVTDLCITEVQIGDRFDESDIERFSFDEVEEIT